MQQPAAAAAITGGAGQPVNQVFADTLRRGSIILVSSLVKYVVVIASLQQEC